MRILKILVLLLTLFLFVQVDTTAQKTRTGQTNSSNNLGKGLTGKKQFDWGRVFLGGTFGGNLGFSSGGNSAQFLELSPIVGYRLTDKFSAGVGPIFNYFKRPNFDGQTIWGTRALARYSIMQNIFLGAEISNIWFKCNNVTESIRSLPIGGGYRQRMVGRSSFIAEVMYDILYKADGGTANNPCVFDPGTGLIYRVGFNVGF